MKTQQECEEVRQRLYEWFGTMNNKTKPFAEGMIDALSWVLGDDSSLESWKKEFFDPK